MNLLIVETVYVSKGGVEVIDKLIEKYGRRLYGLCRTLCDSPADADDLYQETWLKVCQKINPYNSAYEFEGWLTKICVNIYRDTYRKKKTSRIFDSFISNVEKDSVLEHTLASEDPDFTDLHEAVHKLPEKLRLTITLYYFRDLDINQTAQVLSIPSGTVKSRLNKAKKLLKEMIEDEIEL